MALFESYERREPQILACLKEYGISSIEECTMYIVLRSDDGQDGRKFVSSYMISRTVKLLSCLLFLLLYMFLNREDALRFGIAFMVIYFLYAIFEIFLLKQEKK